jgi:uncharacterized protein YpbB
MEYLELLKFALLLMITVGVLGLLWQSVKDADTIRELERDLKWSTSTWKGLQESMRLERIHGQEQVESLNKAIELSVKNKEVLRDELRRAKEDTEFVKMERNNNWSKIVDLKAQIQEQVKFIEHLQRRLKRKKK